MINKMHLSVNGLVVKILNSIKEIEEIYKLRHSVFCEELNWVPDALTKREKDVYDNYCIHLGVFSGKDHTLLGCVRLVRSFLPIMLEKEFKSLLWPDYRIRKALDTVEITRLAIKKSARFQNEFNIISEIHNAIYLWCSLNDVNYLYFVVEESVFKSLVRHGYQCEKIGPVKQLEGGVRSLAVLINLKKLNESELPKFLKPVVDSYSLLTL